MPVLQLFTPTPASSPYAVGPSKPWVQRLHPEYETLLDKWMWTWYHYTGECLSPRSIETFLLRRATGESDDQYRERVRLADYTNHLAAIIDSLAGMVFATEDDVTRVLRTDSNEGLGDLTVVESPIANLWSDVDGTGISWTTVHKRLAVDLIVYQGIWGMVTSPEGDPRLQYLPPTSVLNWVELAPGQITEAVVQTVVDTRSSLRSDAAAAEIRYRYYTTEGWTTWRVDDRNEVLPVEGEGMSGTYTITDRWGRPVTPLYRAQVPLRRYVGWLLAIKQNAIFNMENARDYLQWVGSFSKLNIVANDTAFQALTDRMARGQNVLQDDPQTAKSHHYISPPTENAKALTDTLKRKVEEFYISAFREYGDSAKERTATEVRQDSAAGVGAFLQLLKAALDDAETQALGRVAQVLFPNEPDRWWVARVERSNEVVPLDVQALIEKLITRTYGQGESVPFGQSGLVDAALEIARYDGRRVDVEQVKSSVRLKVLRDNVDSVREFIPLLPDEAKVELGLQMLDAMGAVPPGKTIDGLRADALQKIEADRETEAALNRMAAAPPAPNQEGM